MEGLKNILRRIAPPRYLATLEEFADAAEGTITLHQHGSPFYTPSPGAVMYGRAAVQPFLIYFDLEGRTGEGRKLSFHISTLTERFGEDVSEAYLKHARRAVEAAHYVRTRSPSVDIRICEELPEYQPSIASLIAGP